MEAARERDQFSPDRVEARDGLFEAHSGRVDALSEPHAPLWRVTGLWRGSLVASCPYLEGRYALRGASDRMSCLSDDPTT